MASWTAWVAHKTLRPAEAAKLLQVDESTLRDLNRIPRGMLIRQGSALLVPRGEHHTEDVSERVADGGAVMLQQEVEPSAKAKGKPSAKPSSKDKAKAASPTKAVAKANAKTPTSTVKGSPAPNTKDRAASAQRR